MILKKQRAFTLAEVLIVIGIIGIVAESTIPTLVQSTHEQETVVQLEKVYSNLQNVYNLSKYDNGKFSDYMPKDANWYNTDSHKQFREYFMKYFNSPLRVGGLNAGVLKMISGVYYFNDGNSFQSFVDRNGTVYSFRFLHPEPGSFGTYGKDSVPAYGDIFVILNYKKEKKIYTAGKEVFLFHFGEKIVPGGASGVNKSPLSCYTNQLACTQWVLTYKNLDYLHCNDLSWNEKHTCN